MLEMKNNKGKTVFSGIGIALLLCLLMVMMPLASTVSNGDKIEEISTNVETDEKVGIDATESRSDSAAFVADDYGYDEDMEMIGMRDQNSKVFIDEEGGLDMVYSSNPLHYIDSSGQWADIDYSIDATANGFEVVDTDSPITFGSNVNSGYTVNYPNGVELISGLDPMVVTLTLDQDNSLSEGLVLLGQEEANTKHASTTVGDGMVSGAMIMPLGLNQQDSTLVGGNTISYELVDSMELQYTVEKDTIKQDLVVVEMPNWYKETIDSTDTGYFGLLERFEIPDGHVLSSADGQILSADLFTNGEIFSTQENLFIMDLSTGENVIRIDTPVAFDTKSYDADDNEAEAIYFLRVDSIGASAEMITAVPHSWILAEETNFPVTIDPTFTFVSPQVGSGSTTYPVCGVNELDCIDKTNGEYRYEEYGAMWYSPRFGYQFNANLPNGLPASMVEAVDVKVDWDPVNNGHADIVILEDCGVNSLGSPDGDRLNLEQFANPSGCTGVALPDYSPSNINTPTSGSQTLTGSSGGSGWQYCSSSNCPLPGGYAYQFRILDSYGDGWAGDLQIGTRAVGSSSYSYSTIINGVSGSAAWGTYQSSWVTVNVASTDEIRWRMGCANAAYYHYCYETTIEWSVAFPGANLPAIPSQTPSTTPPASPPSSSSPSSTFTLNQGFEARMTWTCGSWCEENSVYYRTQGTTGWTNSWEPGTGQSGTDYYSNSDGIVFQTPGTYEFLVFDSADDGTDGGAGTIESSPIGTWGTMPITPEGQRLISMVSSKSLGYYTTSGSADSSTTLTLCATATSCNDPANAELQMLMDAIANAGYIEFGLGFANTQNANTNGQSLSPHAGTGGYYQDGRHYVDEFTLIIDFESNVPDTTAPVDMTPVHYEVDSYAEGPRTLFVSLEDSEYAIDTTASNGPKLWYSIDGSNPIPAASTLVHPVNPNTGTPECLGKEITCTFSAQTSHVEAGETVDYYWTYSDAAGPTSAKPSQSPNGGQTATMQFSVLDPVTSTDRKLTVLVENVLASYDQGVKSSSTNTIDRQMTYYADSGEYLFEFDTSECDSYTQTTYTCFTDTAAQDDEYGHWDVLWQDSGSSTTDCYPGKSGCTGTADNIMDLTQDGGGMFEISKHVGTGSNIAMVFDEAANAWAVAGVGASPSIADRLEVAAPDANFEANSPSGMTDQDLTVPFSTTEYNNGYGPQTASFTVPTGNEARVGYDCGSYCNEAGGIITDTNSGATYVYGRVPGGGSGDGFRTQTTSQWGTTCSSVSSSAAVVWSNAVPSSVTACGLVNTLPNNGLLPAGSYTIAHYDSYGDGSNGGFFVLQYQSIGGSWVADPNVVNYAQTGAVWSSYGWSIDLADSATPSLGNNAKFAHTSLGANGANMVCVTTNGLIYFKDSSNTDCPGDATASSSGGQWAGFAMGATVQGEQQGLDGMLWSIRDIAPDPDLTAPVIEHVAMGDSHALERTVSAVIYDPGYQPSGVDVTPGLGNGGPTLHYEVFSTAGTPTGAMTQVAMIPDGSLADCEDGECTWSADLPALSNTRDQSVTYYVTAQDNSPAGVNTVQTTTATFKAALPTNTLVLEWRGLSSDSTGLYTCTFQTVMYDVTNEIEFHYDESCSADEIQGIIGHRMDASNAYTIDNKDDVTSSGNPHTDNIRVTWGQDGYSYEYFDLGIEDPLPASSQQLISASSSTAFRTQKCHAQNWATLANSCVANFDIPDGFSFDYHGASGTTFDGNDGTNDRIHVSLDGMFYFLDNGNTAQNPQFDTAWIQNPAMDDMNSANAFYEDNMIAPWWSPTANDYCSSSKGCDGVWFRTIPFDGQGTRVNADITVDTTWFEVDSPIKVVPSSQTGYLSVTADLTIEPGVEVIIAEGTGISFDGGVQADGTCASLIADGTANDRITFNADRSTNANALWHGLAFTDECNGGTDGRHVFDNVDMSNTNYAAITAGSRPAPNQPSQYSCGTTSTDCNVGEFEMSEMTFDNVDSAFAHGSGQGTEVTLSAFAVSNARSACFNFAENTIATLSGTPSNPSTMTGCNTNKVSWGGAVVNMPGSSAGSLTMVNIDIVDSFVNLVDVDLKDVTISNVDATMSTATSNSGVNLASSHASGATVVVSDFSAPDYDHGWIYASGQVSLTNVDFGASSSYYDIKPFGGGSSPGASGANAVFDTVTAGNLYVHRTAPSTFDDVTVTNSLWFQDSGVHSQLIEVDGASAGHEFVVIGAGSNVKVTDSNFGAFVTISQTGTKNTIDLFNVDLQPSQGTQALYSYRSDVTMIESDITMNPAAGGSWSYLNVDDGSTLYLIASTADNGAGPLDCASAAGETGDCAYAMSSATTSGYSSQIFYGGYANALAYRSAGGGTVQITQQDVTIRTKTLDASGNLVAEIGSALTDSTGQTSKVVVLTQLHTASGDSYYDTHIVSASGSAGVGLLEPGDDLAFVNGVAQTPGTTFSTYTIGSFVDIKLLAPPVVFDSQNMDCNWMQNTNNTFMNAWDSARNAFVFKGASLTVAADMNFDGCSVVLEGSMLLFRPGNPQPKVTLSSGSTLTMDVDGDTGDQAQILGEGGAKSVDIRIQSGGTLDVQTGKVQDLYRTYSKTGLLVIESGGTLSMTNSAEIVSSNIQALGSTYPIVRSEGGTVNINGGVISGVGSTGVGLSGLDAFISATSLTVTNAYIGVRGEDSALSLDDFTSTDNVYGLVAKGSMELPQIYRSATLQGLSPTSLDKCIISSYYGCSGWESYSVDFSTYLGEKDFIQFGMDMIYDGTRTDPWTGAGQGFITVDNLKVIASNGASSWEIETSSDLGYYPHSASDPSSGVGSVAAYAGGVGGSPNWDCNFLGRSYNPVSSIGNTMYNWYPGLSFSTGALYGVTGWGYPTEFGFRWVESGNNNFYASNYPRMEWAAQNVWSLNNARYFNNGYSNNIQSPAASNGGWFDSCQARASSTTQTGTGAIMQWPIVDISDSSITSVRMEFEMFHEYNAWPGRVNYANNNNGDNLQVTARASDVPSAMGDWTTTLPNNGVSITNSNINGAVRGIYLLGDTSMEITNSNVKNPSQYGVYTTGDNDVVFDSLTVSDNSGVLSNNYGFYSGQYVTGDISIKNSNFNGMGTSIYFNNDVGTAVENTVLSNGDTGLKIGTQSDANYELDGLTINNMNIGVEAEGVGSLKIKDCAFSGNAVKDVVLDGARNAEFLDGDVDSNKVDVLGTGSLLRSRSYFATLTADTNPVTDANVILSSRDAGTYTLGKTDSVTGVTTGLEYNVFKVDAGNVFIDYSSYFNTYQLSTVAQIGTYSYTDSTTNNGDFRYEVEVLDGTVTGHELTDALYDQATGENFDTFDLTKTVDIRICSGLSTHTVVAPCAGTMASTDERQYTSGMMEYGSEESLWDVTGTVDLSNKVIMSDTGTFELRDGMTYILDGSTIFMTGYRTLDALGEWTVEAPYGTTIEMDGGSFNGVLPETAGGAPVGFMLGGIDFVSDAPLAFDVNNVEFNGIASMSAYNGDWATGSWTGLSDYEVGEFEVTNSVFNHYRGFRAEWANTLWQEDMCMRLSGGDGGLIDNNIFNDCTVGIFFDQSDWLVDSSQLGSPDDRVTQQMHDDNGSDQFVISNNVFQGGAGFSIWSYWDADADEMEVANNDMNCNSCEGHVVIYGDSSLGPNIHDNVMRNGEYGVQTVGSTTRGVTGPQLVKVANNQFSDQTVSSVFIDGGDADVTGNQITDSMGGITASGFDKPTEIITSLVAGINTGRAVNGQFINFNSGDYSQTIEYNLAAGDELQLIFTCGFAYCYEPEIDYKEPGVAGWTNWDPSGSSGAYGTILQTPGTYKFRMYDSYGDGPQGAMLEVYKGDLGTWSSSASLVPANPSTWACTGSWSGCNNAYHSNLDGVVIQNLGAVETTWGFQMTDSYGDGANGNSYSLYTAPAGTWNTASTGPLGIYAGGINDNGANSPSFTGSTNAGDYSDWIYITLQPNDELKMVFSCANYCSESAIDYGDIPPVPETWTGPDIHNNIITNTNFEPNAYGMRFEDCDMTLYTISTRSNQVTIGQDALVVDSCTWEDTNSVLTGTDQAGSVGFNDDNAYGAPVVLSGTVISGFETGVLKTSGDLTLNNGASFTAGDNGNGVSTDGIDVVAEGITVDGGSTGTGMSVSNSNSLTMDNVDTLGNNGVSVTGTEFTWTGGNTANSGTTLTVSDSTGDLTSIVDTGTGNQIDASTESYVNSIDFSLDEAKMVVDATSIVDESNWLSIDANHLGEEPLNEVGLVIISNNGYSAFSTPTFENTMVVDGASADDWFGGNDLNPSGYAYPGEVSPDFFVTSDNTNMYFGFDNVGANDNIVVYFNTNDLAGDSADSSATHTLPFGAEHMMTIGSDGTNSFMSHSLTGWQTSTANGALNVASDAGFVEASFPISGLGSYTDCADIVVLISDDTTGDLTVVHPAPAGGITAGAMVLTDSYKMELGTQDLADGTMTDQVMLYRSFMFSSTPTAGHTYDIMVKTEAEARHTCHYDWSTLTDEGLQPILMDQSHSVSFDILRACPEILATVDILSEEQVQSSEFYECSSWNDWWCYDQILGEGTYEAVVHDSFGDGPNGGQLEVDSRPVGRSWWSSSTWTSGTSWTGSTSPTIAFTVQPGYEARFKYDCSSSCSETSVSLSKEGVLGDISVYEDSAFNTLQLATFVTDEQDVEANMKWDVVGSNIDAFDNILTDWSDQSAVDGTLSITPINDQFGTFELEFTVVDSHGQTDTASIEYTVINVNDAPVICDARQDADPNCDNGQMNLYTDGTNVNVRSEGFSSYTEPLGVKANDTGNSYIRDMANEQDPVDQVYTWSVSTPADCVQFTKVSVVGDDLVIEENTDWEEGGICDITLDLEDNGQEFCLNSATGVTGALSKAVCESNGDTWMGENTAQSVVVPFKVAPVNDVPEIADDTTYNNNNGILVDSADSTTEWVADGVDYKVTLVEDTTNPDTLTFDLSSIKSDIDHVDADLSWNLRDSDDCDSSNYFTTSWAGPDLLQFTLIEDATTNAPDWEMDMLNNNGIHQVNPTTAGNCPMHLTLSDSASPPSYMPNYTAFTPNNYQQESVEVDLYVTVDNVKEAVPDYEFRADEGFFFNGVSNIMPGTYVPVDFSIYSSTTTGDAPPNQDGSYTYERLLKVTVHSDGHDEPELPKYYQPPAYGQSLSIDDWQVFITDQTTEVWVEMDVVTCIPGPVCDPSTIQLDEPSSHLSTVGANPNPWSEPGKSTSNRAPAFEDRNWCNNLMSTNSMDADTPLSGVVLQSNCQHTSDAYIASESGFAAQQWQNTGQSLPVVVGTIGALAVPSFTPSLIAVCLTGLFVSALVFASRREDDEESFEEEMSDDESAVSPVIATILMVAITVVLSGVVYVWAAQLADVDTKGVPRVTFTAENMDTGSTDTDHWKFTVGQSQTALATQAVEVQVTYVDANGDTVTDKVNLASTDQVYGFSPFNSDSLVTFGDVTTDEGSETVSSFSSGDDIFVRTHVDGHPLVEATVSITYAPPVGEGALLVKFTGLSWNQPA